MDHFQQIEPAEKNNLKYQIIIQNLRLLPYGLPWSNKPLKNINKNQFEGLKFKIEILPGPPLNQTTNGSVTGLDLDSKSQKKYDFSPPEPEKFMCPLYCWTSGSHSLPLLMMFVGSAWKSWLPNAFVTLLSIFSRSNSNWPEIPKGKGPKIHINYQGSKKFISSMAVFSQNINSVSLFSRCPSGKFTRRNCFIKTL